MKTSKIFKIIILLFGVVTSPIIYAGFFGESTQGWHWYQDPLIESPNPEHLSEQQIAVPRTPTEIVEAYRKQLEARLHLAWINPTPKNVQSYQELQKDMMDRAQGFSKAWMQVVYNNPHLDHTLIAPVNHKARHLYLDNQRNETTGVIQGLAQNYGLFFFFDSQCQYCHQFAPIVKRFSETYGWEVMAISVDGGTIDGFSRTANNNGILQQWKVDVVPALFAVNPHTSHIIPVAYGVASLDEMETRIMALSQGVKETQ